MRSLNIFSVAALLLLFSGCGSTSGEDMSFGTERSESGLTKPNWSEDRSADAVGRTSSAIPAPRSDVPAQLVGAWISLSCGDRQYTRMIAFHPDETFAAEDRISPCPPDVACFWSGILYHRGRFTVVENTIKLEVSEPRSSASSLAFPTTLEMDPATGAPMEGSPDGELCVYTRAPEMPPDPRL
jgi:hypothetical protein